MITVTSRVVQVKWLTSLNAKKLMYPWVYTGYLYLKKLINKGPAPAYFGMNISKTVETWRFYGVPFASALFIF